MNEFQFKPEVAELYGVNEAIFLHSLSFWLIKNQSNRRNFHDGHYWSYDTYKAIAERFPFWTVRQIERIVVSCEEQGAILIGNYNDDKTDRTKWYTLGADAEAIYLPKTVDCNSPNGEMTVPQAVPCDTPDGVMGEKQANAITQTVNCNKEAVTYAGKDTPLKPPKGGRRQKGLSAEVRAMLNEYVGHDRELAEELGLLMAVRTEKRAVNSVKAIEALLKELDKLSDGDRETKLQLLKQSALNSWKSVFPLKGSRGSYSQREEGERVVV